jgi:L-asparagine transporter-like permease
VPVLLVGFLLRPMDIFGFLGTIATLAAIVLYSMANLALTSYVRREPPQQFSIWRHAIIPWMGTLALLPVLFITVFPVPSWPYNITPYVFGALLLGGVAYMQWLQARDGEALSRGATMLVGSPMGTVGEVEWEPPSKK